MAGKTFTTFDALGNVISLIRETPSRLPFGAPKREVVDVDEWPLARPDGAAAGVAHVLQALGDEETAGDGLPLVSVVGGAATLHPAFVARLNDSEAQALGLPPATRLALNLRSSGLIQRDGFHLETSWTRNGGVSERVKPLDGRLVHGGREWRIPEPLYSTLNHVAAVNAAIDEPTRQAALAALKRTMGEDASARISADGVIERLRLSYASGFSLAISPSAAGFDFDPVLFGRERLDAADAGASLDETEDSLLPPALATGFARRFRSGDGTRRTYLLDDGSLLFIDPQLSRVLGVVRKAQTGSPDERRAFAASPERYVAQALGNAGEDTGDIARLFIETQQFSERVAGIDIWRKPVLPWIKPKPNSWLPESFGLRIGDPPDARTIAISPERLPEAVDVADNAVREERATFQWDGETIPATQATVAALAGLADIIPSSRSTDDEVRPPEALNQRYFLQVRDNLEDVAYAPLTNGPERAVPASPVELPSVLRSAPKPHQVEGFQWLARCWQSGVPGVLLADDMGLGKTYQALAFLAWVRRLDPHSRPVLIIAPTGLLSNWQAEIARHLEPDALGRVVNVYGSGLAQLRQGAARDISSGASAIDPTVWAHAGVVLTTYETMRDYHLSFARQPFAAILYDEAQKLKNPASQLTRAAKTLNARFQLALTGTPVENRLQDLWSIFDVLHPGLLGSSKAFEERYPAEPEALKVLNDKLTLDEGGRPPVLLRRLKEECLSSLPAKHIRPMPIPMPTQQVAAYDRVVARALAMKGTGQRGRMLEVLHQLRGVSLHPRSPESAGDESSYFEDSARLTALFSVLDDIAGKQEKVLVFCESLAMQALLAAEIRRRYKLAYSVARIHGGVPGQARQAIVDIFQERGPGFDAMILSPKAGGVGLTITAANHIVHLSRWWNPAVEDQATDRAYRIGQTRDVFVYLPQAVHPDAALAPTSFDLKLHELMERKRQLSRGLFAPGEDEAETEALFDCVVTDATPPPLSPEPARTPVAAPTGTPPPAQRSRLSLRPRAEQSPPTADQQAAVRPAQTWPSRIVYEPDRFRDLTIFRAPLQDDPPREVTIIDPYAAAGHRARKAVVDFVGILAEAGTPHTVHLVTYDGESIERPPETSPEQYDQMQAHWRQRFGSEVVLRHQQRSKRQAADLHDREVRIVTKSGRTFLWDLGRGIDGVMGTRFGCRVNLTEL